MRVEPNGTTTFPMPGDVITDETVIASCYYGEDGEEAIILTLGTVPPYYKVIEVKLGDFDLYPKIMSWTFENIVPATAFYQELSQAWGGD